METSASRVAKLVLHRNSRKDLSNLGTLFSRWSKCTPNEPTRRMTMGGAPPPAQEPVIDASLDAFCAIHLTSSNSISKPESLLHSPRGSYTNLANFLLSPVNNLKDGSALLSPQNSLKASLEVLYRPALEADTESDEVTQDDKGAVTAPAVVTSV